MSGDDHWVDSLSDDEIQKIAERAKRNFGVENKSPVDIISCLKQGSVVTRLGRKHLIYQILTDSDMVGDDGKTELVAQNIVISVKRSVHNKAKWGEGRARMTLAHELAHAIMHPGTAKARRSGAIGRSKDGNIPAHRSAEHQAKVFAVNFLVDRGRASSLGNAEEISAQFSISLEAARILYNEIELKKEKNRSVELIRRLADDFIKDVRGSKREEPTYMKDLCPACGQQKLAPIGVKFHCYNCDSTSDLFADGDRLD